MGYHIAIVINGWGIYFHLPRTVIIKGRESNNVVTRLPVSRRYEHNGHVPEAELRIHCYKRGPRGQPQPKRPWQHNP